jgi:Co/Zn/Cd efflux system component
MAHIRKPLAAAALLNTAVFTIEAAAGTRGHSLSLLMDGVHNFSDELALLCLLAAYVFAVALSRGLQRMANLLNSLGLIAVSVFVVWQALDRLLHPLLVIGWLPAIVGLLAAAGNWGVARCLRDWRHESPSIRLAYLHNISDMYVSLAPAAERSDFPDRSILLRSPRCARCGGLAIVSTGLETRRSVTICCGPRTRGALTTTRQRCTRRDP